MNATASSLIRFALLENTGNDTGLSARIARSTCSGSPLNSGTP